MNVQDIVTRVRRTFGDEAAVQVTNEDIIRWINDGQVEIIKNNDTALEKTAFVNLVAGQSSYTLPTDLLILRALRFKYPTMNSFSRLSFKSMQQFDEEIDGWDGTGYNNSSPSYFTLYEGNALLFPTPDTSSTNGLKVLYNQKPADVDDVLDTLALPIIYHNTIMKYCMWQASLLDEDHEPAMMYRTDFAGDLGVLANNETSDPVATYHTITVLEYDA